MDTTEDAARSLLTGGYTNVAQEIIGTLVRFGGTALRYAHAAGVRVHALTPNIRYRDASATLRRLGLDVDAWPIPPSGLFVVEERRVYLRNCSPMTVAHELGHALDCALGGGVYRSMHDPEIRAAFRAASRHVTPYAAVSLDEYFAESLRAYVEVNDPLSAWPQVSRSRLAAYDPTMFAILEDLIARECTRAFHS
ncbi:MAG TPA: hypothetical protein VGZ00_02745 [Candidatus Baltobacteraceae bacterium]|jgi:hypothetical protein|nr:hypothetical protein [Candidatus Baltobacteraceae bacterium]